MSRILLHVDQAENRRLLAEWLRGRYQVLLPESADALDQPFDLCLVDGPALKRLKHHVRARKALEQPLLLPVLLVTPRREAGRAGPELWATVDEMITTPIEKAELDSRLQALLRMRHLSVELKLSNDARFHHLARFDALTDLPNRAMLQEQLNFALLQADATQRQVAVLYLDLDRFKAVNESFGYAYGDILLQAIAERLRHCLGEGYPVARPGDDEFAIVVPQLASSEEAADVARQALAALAAPFRVFGRELYSSASIGIAFYPDDAQDGGSLLRQAETAMSLAKEGGGNLYHFYTEAMQQRVQERLALETALHRALEQQSFVLHYQPKVSIASGKVVGLEALLRWPDPERGLISPARFIPVAEETGMILPLGEWALRTACRQQVLWRKAGVEAPPIAVNLSIRQFNGQLEEMVGRVLRQTQADPELLELEITESIMQQAESSIVTMHAIRRLGIEFSIDDFGTGYSSMSYLKRLPVSALKIDQSFVRELVSDEDSRTIVRAVINLAHSLKLAVIAEGVESAGQFAYLRQQGCDTVQGFLFSRPLSAEEYPGLRIDFERMLEAA